MDRTTLENKIREVYGGEPDYPWEKYPEYAVYRHRQNGKWYALFMEVPREKLGLPGAGPLSVVNLKCGPVMAGSLRTEPGLFPAYHMNKDHWITAALDGSADDSLLELLLEQSFQLTAAKIKNKRRPAGK